VRVAVVLACAASACASLEGLDPYQLCASDCEQGSGDASPRPPDATTDETAAGDSAPSDAAAAGDAADGQAADEQGVEPPPDARSLVDGGDAASPLEAGSGDAGCTCVASVPSGWSGYVQVLLNDGGAPSCAAPYGSTQGAKKTAPAGSAAQCTPCTCGFPPSGPIACQVSLGSGGAICAGEAMTVAPAGVCVLPPGPMGITSGPNGDSYGPTAVPAPVGTCSPDGGRLSQPLPAATYSTAAICASVGGTDSQGGCASGDLCVPSPRALAGSPSGVCIYKAGAQSCPAGAYSMAIVVADAVVDTRACGSCSCAAPSCPADGYVQGYTSLNCTGAVAATFDASTPCTFGNNPNASVSFMYTPSHASWAGTCGPAGGGSQGSVTLDGTTTTTYCCIP
jgi:hypothetical protein